MKISEAIALADPGYELYGVVIEGRVTGIELIMRLVRSLVFGASAKKKPSPLPHSELDMTNPRFFPVARASEQSTADPKSAHGRSPSDPTFCIRNAWSI